MKYCDDYAALLDLFVDGELSPAEMADVQAHLDGCPGCRAYVDDALAIRAAFPDAEETEVPAGFAEGVMSAVRAQTPPKKRKLSHLLAPLAACCAIVLLIRGVGFGGSKYEAADAESPMAAESYMETPMEEPAAMAEDDSQTAFAVTAAPTDALPYEAAKNAAEDMSRVSSPYFAVLTLPADALETALLADRAPADEEDGQQRYELSSGDYAALLDQLDAAGIQPLAREQTGADSETALVIVTGL